LREKFGYLNERMDGEKKKFIKICE